MNRMPSWLKSLIRWLYWRTIGVSEAAQWEREVQERILAQEERNHMEEGWVNDDLPLA